MTPAHGRAHRHTVALDVGQPKGIPYEIVTPEGVPLPVLLATAGDRFAAFVLDALLMALGLFAIVFSVLWVLPGMESPGWALPFLLVALFLIRNFYFTWFETRRRGATPGKRRLGLHVVDSGGGPLTAEAVIARNLMREIELWTPMMLLLNAEGLWPSSPGWARFVAILWTIVLSGFPLFNRKRLRLGDLVGGTLVVVRPRAVLLGDVGRAAVERAAPRVEAATPPEGASAPPPATAGAGAFGFTDAQLDVYGIYELQVLEQALRKGHGAARDREALDAIAQKIRKKIRWEGAVNRNPEPFLQDFYAALRARLEHRMLLGKRKEDKHSK